MKSVEIIRAIATLFGIGVGASLGFWTAAEPHLTGVGVTSAWYGLVDVALTYVTVASGTVSSVLHITDYAGRLSGRKQEGEPE